MKFDKIVNTVIKEMVLTEGRTPKLSKYSNIAVDTAKLGEKIEAGDFDVLIKSWSGSPKYGNLSEEDIKSALTSVKDNIETYQPTSLKDLFSAIESPVDEIYSSKGPRRKTFTDRLTKSISNLILHKEYDLISVGMGSETPNYSETDDDETSSTGREEFDVEGLSSIQSAIYEFIKQSDAPTTEQELNNQFPNDADAIQELLTKGLITKEGNTFSLPSEPSDIPLLDIEDEEEEEDPFETDPNARETFKRTFGDTRSDEGEWDEWDRDQVPSWLR